MKLKSILIIVVVCCSALWTVQILLGQQQVTHVTIKEHQEVKDLVIDQLREIKQLKLANQQLFAIRQAYIDFVEDIQKAESVEQVKAVLKKYGWKENIPKEESTKNDS